MTNPVKIGLGCGIPLVIILVLFGLIAAWFKDRTTYHVDKYLPTEVIDSVTKDNKGILRMRGSEFQFGPATLNIEWNRYDNQNITRPPYKLLIIDRSEAPSEIAEIVLQNVEIRSSIVPDLLYPIEGTFPRKLEIGSSARFEPEFNFSFDSQEEIWLKLAVEITMKDGSTIRDEKEIHYRPIRVTMYAPLV